MGFGLLFIGYLLTFLLSMAGGYGAYPAIVGCLVLLYAQTKLAEYEKNFKYSFFATLPMTACVAYELAVSAVTMMGISLPGFLGSAGMEAAMKYAGFVFEFAFHCFLLLAIAKIAGDTELGKQKTAAWRNLIIYGVYFATAVVASLISPETDAAPYLFLAQFVMYLVCMILNGVLIFSCYMHICDENDQDMKAKPSRFEAVNRFREEFDRREEKARQKSREYRAEKMQKRAEQLKNKKKKKK